jgi:hypothetical protein
MSIIALQLRGSRAEKMEEAAASITTTYSDTYRISDYIVTKLFGSYDRASFYLLGIILIGSLLLILSIVLYKVVSVRIYKTPTTRVALQINAPRSSLIIDLLSIQTPVTDIKVYATSICKDLNIKWNIKGPSMMIDWSDLTIMNKITGERWVVPKRIRLDPIGAWKIKKIIKQTYLPSLMLITPDKMHRPNIQVQNIEMLSTPFDTYNSQQALCGA